MSRMFQMIFFLMCFKSVNNFHWCVAHYKIDLQFLLLLLFCIQHISYVITKYFYSLLSLHASIYYFSLHY